VHTRRAAEPERSLAELAGPVAELAERNGLRSHPGKLVLEIRIPDLSKATALGELLDDDAAALYAGDDLGDLPAVAEVRAWAARTGRPALTIAVGEVAELRAAADRAVASPAALAALLAGLLSRA
jgi:trehalose 6-phosphate phosphatase